jgi:FkbM family methyltransferase
MEIIKSENNVYGVDIVSYEDFIYQLSIKENRLWDEEVVVEILNNYIQGTDILDIGANIGLVTLGVLKKANEKNIFINKIHCFECDTQLFNLLKSNVSTFNNIYLYPFPVAQKEILCNLSLLDYNHGCNYIYSTQDGIEKKDYSSFSESDYHFKRDNIFFLGTSLDNIKYNFKNKISVIKIDVEGFELNVLNGAIFIILENRPVIIVEVFEKNFNNVLKFFEKVKYSSYIKLNSSIYQNEDYIFYP